MRKRIVVTGAAGRIGQAFIKAHRDRFDITGFDQKPSPNVERSVTANLTDLAALTEAARGCTAMVHLGAFANHHQDYPGVIVANNIVGTYHAFEAAARARVQRVVFASTVQTEFGWGEGIKVSVSMPARPTNFYSSSKVFGEHVGFLFSRDRGLSVICLRIGGVLGPEPEQDLIESGDLPADIALFTPDAVEILKRAVEVEGVTYEVVPAYSLNAEAIKDLEPLRRVLGFTPQLDARLVARAAEEAAGIRPTRDRIKEMMDAAGRGDLAAVRGVADADPRLIDVIGRGPDWEDRNVRPIHLAARRGHTEVVRFLLDRGAVADGEGGRPPWTPAQLAAIHGHPGTAALLLERGAVEEIFTAAALGHVSRLAAFLEARPEAATTPRENGMTPLHVAGTPEVVDLLIAHGADPDARDTWRRRSPLMTAMGKPEVARALAARLGALDIFTASALGDVALAERLLAADPALANTATPAGGHFWAGRRPLHLAIPRGHAGMVKVLLAHGADPNAPDPEGGSALHIAAWHGQLDVIRTLVAAGARLEMGDAEWSATPRDWAEYAKQTEAVKLLDALAAAAPPHRTEPQARPIRRVLLTGGDTAAGRSFKLAAGGLDVVEAGDLSAATLTERATGCDAVIHCGGAATDAPFATLLEDDVLGTWHALEAAHQAAVGQFVFASTTEVMSGWPAGTDLNPEKTPLRPGSLWAAVKALNEHLCLAYGKRMHTPAVSIRLDGKDDGANLLEALERDKGKK